MSFFKRKIFYNQKGSVVVDYLLTTAMIAGILVPIILKYGGESFTSNLLSQRQKMVTFLAQDRKQNVPNSWFSQELTPNVQGNNPNITVADNISEGDSTSPDNISTGGDPKVANLSDPNNNKVNSPDNINVGNPGGNGSGSGINTGNTNGTGSSASGVGPGASGGGANSEDFFSGKNGEGKTAETNSRKGADGSVYSASGRGGNTADGEDSEVGGGSAEKEKGKKEDQGKDKSENVADSRKRTQDNLRLAEQQVEKRRGEFDWWLLLKILIVCLIIFLAVLIALSNLKRR